MSKTFEKNWVGEIKNYWRRSAEWATDLRNRYAHDIFFRTECNVIILQVIFAAVLTGIVAVVFNYLYKDILNTLVTGIIQSLKSHGSVDATAILNSVEIVRANNFLLFLSFVLLATVVFSIIIAKVTLVPVRRSLSSQKRFIADVAHELRTPLAVIRTNSEVALISTQVDKEIHKIIVSNIEELDRASGIINNLLTFNNLIKPERMEFGTIDVGNAAHRAVKTVEKLARSKHVGISFHKTAPMTVWGNAAAIDQIALNLIKNAVSYTDAGGTVSIKVGPDYRGAVELVVEDTGRGIAQKDLHHIFEPFFRVESSRGRAHGSSGLGLTIVSELVKSHNGRIRVKSKLGVGTRITVSLPYRADYNAPEPVVDEVTMDFSRHAG